MNANNDALSREKKLLRFQELKIRESLAVAKLYLSNLLEGDPGFYSGWIELAKVYREQNNSCGVIEALQTAVLLKQNDIETQIELATEQLHANQLDAADDTLSRILTLGSEYPRIFSLLGRLFSKRGDSQKSIAYFQKALKFSPKNLWFSLGLADELAYLRRFSEAEEVLCCSLDTHHNNFHLLMKLGNLYKEWDRLEEAASYFQKAINIYPERSGPRLKLSRILQILGRLQDAKSLLTDFVDANHCKYSIFIELARIAKCEQKRKVSIHWLQIASQYASTPVEYQNSQLKASEAFRELGLLNDSLRILASLVEKYPDCIEAKFSKGRILHEMEDLSAASAIYQDILKNDSTHLQSRLRLYDVLTVIGTKEEAIALLKNSPSTVYNTVQLQNKLGEVHRKQGASKIALKYFQKAVSINPQHLWSNISVALELRDLGDLDKAHQQLENTLKYHPDNFQILLQLGDVEKIRNDTRKAMFYYEKSMALQNTKFEPEARIAQLFFHQNQFQRAEEFLQQILEKHSSEWKILMQLGYLEQFRGNSRKALHWFKSATQCATNSIQTKAARIKTIDELRNLGQVGEAQSMANQLLSQDGFDIQARMCLGQILQQQANFSAAATEYEIVLKQDPNHLQCKLELTRILSHSGQVQKAITMLKDTYKKIGANFHVLMQLSHLAIASEEWDNARQWCEEMYREYPLNPKSHIALANILTLQAKAEEALILLSQAEQVFPYTLDISLKTVQIYISLGRLEDALAKLNQLQISFPDFPSFKLYFSRLYLQMGDFENAESCLQNIESDNVTQIREINQLKGELSVQQYKYIQAKDYFSVALDTFPPLHQRNRLAIIFLAQGKLEESLTQLKLATEELGIKSPPGKVHIPLISHPAKIVHAIQSNPFLLDQLTQIRALSESDRLLELAQVIAQDPDYLGSHLILAQEIRTQGIFENIRDSLQRTKAHLSNIPKRIIQYWDSDIPPQGVQTLTKTWKEHNSEYEYQLFSYQDAITFLKQHYSDDDRVFTAFLNCDQPATQADFFRLAYLNKMGGFYADADDRCRKPLDSLLERNPELILLQEDFGCIGNNFIGCIPGQTTIRVAFYRAVTNLLHYSADGPWFQTGPGLITCVLGNTLLPYLSYDDYRLWPRLWILSQAELRAIVTQHISLPYKRTEKSWSYSAYQRRVSSPQKN